MYSSQWTPFLDDMTIYNFNTTHRLDSRARSTTNTPTPSDWVDIPSDQTTLPTQPDAAPLSVNYLSVCVSHYFCAVARAEPPFVCWSLCAIPLYYLVFNALFVVWCSVDIWTCYAPRMLPLLVTLKYYSNHPYCFVLVVSPNHGLHSKRSAT